MLAPTIQSEDLDPTVARITVVGIAVRGTEALCVTVLIAVCTGVLIKLISGLVVHRNPKTLYLGLNPVF